MSKIFKSGREFLNFYKKAELAIPKELKNKVILPEISFSKLVRKFIIFSRYSSVSNAELLKIPFKIAISSKKLDEKLIATIKSPQLSEIVTLVLFSEGPNHLSWKYFTKSEKI